MGPVLSAVSSAVAFQAAQQTIPLAVENLSGCNHCCENAKTYSQICAAHFTLVEMKNRLEACTQKVRAGTADSDVELQKIFLDMSEKMQIARRRIATKRGTFVVTVGVQCVLLVLLVLYLVFGVLRRSARTQANLDELKEQISNLQTQPS